MKHSRLVIGSCNWKLDNHRFDEIAHEEKLIQYEKQIKEKDAAIRDITRQKDNLEIELERLK